MTEIEFLEGYKSCTVKLDRDLYSSLRYAAIKANKTNQSLIYEAIAAYLTTCMAWPEDLPRRGAFIYLLRAGSSAAVKVGKTVVPAARLAQYTHQVGNEWKGEIGYYAMWQLYAAHTTALDAIEDEILERYAAGSNGPDGLPVEGGIRCNRDQMKDRHGQLHVFPFHTRELLGITCFEAVRAVSEILGERGFRVL